eukprot:1161780-Pelagomonas_calceolata.AAC.1
MDPVPNRFLKVGNTAYTHGCREVGNMHMGAGRAACGCSVKPSCPAEVTLPVLTHVPEDI